MRLALALLLLTAVAHAKPRKKLDYADFWDVAGVTWMDTPETVIAKWGKPAKETRGEDGAVDLELVEGVSINWRTSGAIQITISDRAKAWIDAHPSPTTSLVGQTCKEAGARLAFWKKTVPRYLTCKRYDQRNWLVDVTLTCSRRVTLVAIVWVPLPKPDKPYDFAHCKT